MYPCVHIFLLCIADAKRTAAMPVALAELGYLTSAFLLTGSLVKYLLG